MLMNTRTSKRERTAAEVVVGTGRIAWGYTRASPSAAAATNTRLPNRAATSLAGGHDLNAVITIQK